MSRTRRLQRSFWFAFRGFYTAFRQEPNFRIHIFAALCVTLVGLILRLRLIEWVVLVFTIIFVLILELINTAIEAIVDLVSPEIQEKARIAKDVSAAAVFLAALFAVVVGITLFLPKLIML